MARKKEAWLSVAEAAERLAREVGVEPPHELRESRGDLFSRLNRKAELLAVWLDEITAKLEGGSSETKVSKSPKAKKNSHEATVGTDPESAPDAQQEA